jgi:hypothetical protein
MDRRATMASDQRETQVAMFAGTQEGGVFRSTDNEEKLGGN